MSEPASNPAPAKSKSRKRWWICISAVSAAVLGVIWLAGGFDREPTYQNKPASYWLNLDPETTPAGKADSTEEAFKAMGAGAVPFLMKTVNRKPSRMLQRISDFADEHDFPEWITKRLPDQEHIEERRSKAAQLIGELGPRAVAAIPTLLKLLNEADDNGEGITYEAATALQAMGEACVVVVPDLVENLKSTNEMVPIHCADILGAIGPKAAAAVPALKTATADGGPLALASARALVKINHETNCLIQACSNILAQANSSFSSFTPGGENLPFQCVSLLGELGSAAKPVAPMIQSFLLKGGPMERLEAQRALKNIDPELWRATLRQVNENIPAIVTRLTEIISGTDLRQIPRAMQMLDVLGPQAASAVPALIEILNHSPPDLLNNNLVTIARPRGSFVLPATNGLSSSNSIVQPPAMVGQLRSLRFHSMAITALGEIGPAARAAVPKLIALLETNAEAVGDVCCRALGGIGPDAREAVPVLKDLLKSNVPEMRLSAAEALSRIAPDQAADAVVVLRSFLDRPGTVPDPTGRRFTSGNLPFSPTLPWINSRAKVALWRFQALKSSPVEELLKEFEVVKSTATLEWLGDLGPEAKAAIPMLTEFLESDPTGTNPSLTRAAAIALRKIDPEAAQKLGLPGMLALP